MQDFLEIRPHLFTNIGLLVVVLAGSILLERFLRRRYSHVVEADQDAINAVAAAVLGVYGLIVGLTLAAAWDRYQQAEVAVYEETNSLFTVFRLSDTLPEDLIAPMKVAVVEYGAAVAFGELTGKNPDTIDHAPGRKAMRAMYAIIAEAGGMSQPEANNVDILGGITGEVINLDRARGTRLTLEQQSLTREFWIVLIIGAFFTLAAVIAVLPTHPGLHAFITAGVTILMMAMLLLLRDLDLPFEGTQAVNPENFRRGVAILRSEGVESGVAMPELPVVAD